MGASAGQTVCAWNRRAWMRETGGRTMSLTATRFAWKAQGLRPLHKLVLLALADRAGEDGTVWPSQEQLTADTGINAKTTWQAIKALKAAGLIEDTGQRRGRTGQVQVLRLMIDRLPDEGAEGFQKRNHSENGSLPFFPSKHSENGIVKHSENGIRNLPSEPTSEPCTSIPDGTDRLPPCPVSEIIAAYHENLPNNPRVKVQSKSRLKTIAARWREAATLECRPFGYKNQADGIAAWRAFFRVCSESEFLTGRAPGLNGRPPFVADIDFLTSPKGFAGCLENKYHRGAA